MKSRRTLVILTMILLINLILAVTFREFIRQNILIPILYSYWYVRLFIKSLGETCLWPALILVLGLLALRILQKKNKERQRAFNYQEEKFSIEEGRVALWLKYLRRRSIGIENLSMNTFRMKQLVSSVMAYQENLTQIEAEEALEKRRFHLPIDVQTLLFAENKEVPALTQSTLSLIDRIRGWFHIQSNRDDTYSNADMKTIVRFLEDQLELKNDDGD